MIATWGLAFVLAAQMSPDEVERLRGELFVHLLDATGETAVADFETPFVRLIHSPTTGDVTVVRFEERKGKPYVVVRVVCGRDACDSGSFLRKDERALTPADWSGLRDLVPPVLRSRVLPDTGKSTGMWLVENIGAGRRDLVVKATLDYPNVREFVCRAAGLGKLKALPPECAVTPGS